MRPTILVFALGAGLTPALAAADAMSAGMSSASKHGYTGAQQSCYASVFATYATQKSGGGYDVEGKLNKAFKADLQSKCQISK